MGRRPIGKVAMSGGKLAEGYDIGPLKDHIRELHAELARSAKQRADGAVTKPVTKHSTGSSSGEGTGRIRELEADVRLLKDELARERAQRKAVEARTSPTTERIAELDKLLHKYSVKIDELQAQNKRIARAQGGTKAQRSAKRAAARLFKKKT
jgi:chromosome segregation ATPase